MHDLRNRLVLIVLFHLLGLLLLLDLGALLILLVPTGYLKLVHLQLVLTQQVPVHVVVGELHLQRLVLHLLAVHHRRLQLHWT